jgi:hypothetical protein
MGKVLIKHFDDTNPQRLDNYYNVETILLNIYL